MTYYSVFRILCIGGGLGRGLKDLCERYEICDMCLMDGWNVTRSSQCLFLDNLMRVTFCVASGHILHGTTVLSLFSLEQQEAEQGL